MAPETNRIEKKILLNAPRSRVWRALANHDEFGEWFGMNFDGPFTPGAALRATLVKPGTDFDGLPFDITIERMDAETLFSYRWHPHAIVRGADYSAEPTTLVEFTLADAPGGILLTVTESGFDRVPLARRATAFAANSEGWAIMVGVLKEHLAKSR